MWKNENLFALNLFMAMFWESISHHSETFIYRRTGYTHDIQRCYLFVAICFFAMITSGTSKKKFNIFLYLLLVVFLSMSVEHLFKSYAPNTWKDNTMAFFGDIFCFTLIWVSSILASKLMIRGYRRLKNVAIV